MSDDPTQWFHPGNQPAKKDPPADPAPTAPLIPGAGDDSPTTAFPAVDPDDELDGIDDPAPSGPASDGPAPGGLAAGTPPTAAVTDPSSGETGDGLHDLFGEQRDYSGESDWLPATEPEDATAPAPVGATPGADPLGWLGGDEATTAVLPGSAAGLDASAGAAASAGAVSAGAVTTRFDAAPPTGTTATGGPGRGGPGASRRLIVALVIAGGVLLLAIIVAVILLMSQTNATPTSKSSHTASSKASASAKPSSKPSSASPTPSDTPSATATSAPAPTIGSFTVSPTSASCSSTSGNAQLSFSWATSNASNVALSVVGGSVVNNQLTAAGTLSNVPFGCQSATQAYTLTATNSVGITVTQSITVNRTLPAPEPTPTPTPTATATPDADNG